ncbi:urea ABC transporter substrate-binding protein [bacterium]|nr:urea ABC transporter substrate-binding protein [bacterium]
MFNNRWIKSSWIKAGVLAMLFIGGIVGGSVAAKKKDVIKVGILHSLSGTMSISEVAVKDGELLAIEEINAAGGILGKQIVPVIEDGASDWPTFAEKAKKLIMRDKVDVVFGCWTSASRKAVLPVFEKYNHLLVYPVQYEGLEASKNIIYTGATANQQIMPGVSWLLKNKYKKFYLLGSDYVFPRTANLIVKAQLKAEGGILVGEEYTPLGHTEYSTIINKIKAAKPDIVFNSLNGDSNVGFFKQLRAAGITAKDIPTMSVSIAEDEIRGIGAENMLNHFAVWNYFMSMKTPENEKFVKAYKKRFGQDRVTDDPIEANYFGVYLWAKAVEAAGTSDVNKVRVAMRGMKFKAPQGWVSIDPKNNHTRKIVQVGKVNADGQFDILWTSKSQVDPDPFPSLVSNKEVLEPGVIVEKK